MFFRPVAGNADILRGTAVRIPPAASSKHDDKPVAIGSLLQGKVCLITSASSEIGTAFACAYARHGAELVLSAMKGDNLLALQEFCLSSGAPTVVIIEAGMSRACVKH